MEVTLDLVKHLEKMSLIELSEGEREATQGYFQDVIGYLDVISEADTDGVEPLINVFPVSNVMREDVVVPSPEPAVVLANAPNRKGNCFKVPKTVE